MQIPFLFGLSPIILVGYLAIVAYVLFLDARLVKVVERIADKMTISKA